MIPFNFTELLKEKIAGEIAAESARIAAGNAKDWADYRERVGIVKGLQIQERIINDLTEDKK